MLDWLSIKLKKSVRKKVKLNFIKNLKNLILQLKGITVSLVVACQNTSRNFMKESKKSLKKNLREKRIE